jgi:hypothetical protein
MIGIGLHRPSPAAETYIRHRECRRDNRVRETEVDAFIRRGLLNSEPRNDPGAIMDALYVFLDSTLGTTP